MAPCRRVLKRIFSTGMVRSVEHLLSVPAEEFLGAMPVVRVVQVMPVMPAQRVILAVLVLLVLPVVHVMKIMRSGLPR